MRFALEPCELDFCERSPRQIVNDIDLPLDAARSFELCASAEGLGSWLEDFVACTWTSAPPPGVGSTRDVKLTLLTVSERFLAWEPGRRLTFTMTATTLPVFSRAVEDLQFTALSADRTRVRWAVHYDVPVWASLAHPVTRAVFNRIFGRSSRRLERVAAAQARRLAEGG
jgi:hypothetical protein